MRSVAPGLLLVALLGCGGEGRSTQPPEPQPVVRTVASVVVTAPAGALTPGATLTLQAVAKDASGAVIAGKILTWSSSNSGIASVAPGGVVTGVTTGLVLVRAEADGKIGSTQVVVAALPVGSVTIVPPSAPVVAGQATVLAAQVRDRNGGALTGRRMSWSSSAPAVATVDAVTGRLSALSPGTTTITANSEGVTGTLTIAVTAPVGSAAPTIVSIAPATLTPGATVTITGTNFLESGLNVVTVAGVPAPLTSVSPTQLVVTLSSTDLPCRSTQAVPVTVSTVGGAATVRQTLAVATQRALAVGGSFVAGASDAIGCNELPAGGTYLVSVFNAGTSSSIAARFDLEGSSGGAAPSSARIADAPLAALGATPTRAAARSAASVAADAHARRLESDLALFSRLGAPRRARGAAALSRTSAAPVPPTVGALTTLRYHYNSCAASGITDVSARVVYVGPNAIVLEDVAGALAGKIDAELIALAKEFESRSYPLLLNFGNPLAYDAQTDANGRILMLFTPQVNDQGQNLLGFVSGCDLYPPGQDPSVAASNQAEIFYARTVTDTSPTSTTLNGLAQWKRQMPATMVHEAKHITSYAERLSRAAPQFEQIWLEEATAQVASELYGRALRGNAWRGDAAYTPTLWCESRPTTPQCAGGVIAVSDHFAFLADFLQNFENESMLSSSVDSDVYGASWMFVRWAADSYGGANEGAFLRSIVQSPTRIGTANIEAATGKPFAQLLAEFSLMLAADNLPNVRAPFVEPSWNLPDVFAGYAELGLRPPAPLDLRQADAGAFSMSSRSLRGGGASLIRLGAGAPGVTQLLQLRSTPTAPLTPVSTIGLAVLRIQ